MNVLVPVNGSKSSLAAVRHAARLARGADDEVILVNVQPRLNAHAARFVSRAARDAMRAERSAHALSDASALLGAAGVRFRTVAAAGPIARSVAQVAERVRADQIVLGATRRPGWWQAVFSPLPQILECAEVPVSVIGAGRAGAFERYGVPACVGLGLTLLIAAE